MIPVRDRKATTVICSMLAAGLMASCSLLPGSARNSSVSRERIVQVALDQVGTRYRYGGAQPAEGFDCSGLALYAHAAAGLKIPRVSTAQRLAAASVAKRRLAPGDLVFFRTGPGQEHVGIMVDKRHFVHASTSEARVSLAALSDRYWRNHFLSGGSFVAGLRSRDRSERNPGSPFGEL